MASDLVVPVVRKRHLLIAIQRGHSLARVVTEGVVVDGLRAVDILGAHEFIDDPAPNRTIHPHTILDQRAAAREVEVVGPLRRIAQECFRQRTVGDARPVVVALQTPWCRCGRTETAAGVRVSRVAAPLVPGVLRHHVDRDTARHHFGGYRGRHVVHLLEHPLVVVQHRRPAATAGPVHGRAVDVEADVGGARSMGRKTALLIRLRPADVVRGHREARNELRDGPGIAARRDPFQKVLRQHGLLHVRFGVDGGRLAADGNRLADASHFELRADRRDERRAHANVVSLDRPEP